MSQYTEKDIIDYYHHTKFAYNTFWGMKKHQALHFGYWDDKITNFEEALHRENEILAEMAMITKDDYVLDAGCGVGGSSIYLSKTFGCNSHGITLVPDQVNDAKENAKHFEIEDKATFSVQDYTNTNFSDETFDVIWSIESVCHANNKEDFVKEAFRILRPGGRVILADYLLSQKPQTQENLELYNQWITGWFLPYIETVENFKELLVKNGFPNELITYTNATEYAKPSTKKLHDVSKKAKPIVWFLKQLRIRNQYHYNNIKASIAQYKLLEKKVWQYGIFSVKKPI